MLIPSFYVFYRGEQCQPKLLYQYLHACSWILIIESVYLLRAFWSELLKNHYW